jgi:hypothetical protein
VTSYERRGRADGPASDRSNFTTAAGENQHPWLATTANVGRAPRLRRCADTFKQREAKAAPIVAATRFSERGMNSRVVTSTG